MKHVLIVFLFVLVGCGGAPPAGSDNPTLDPLVSAQTATAGAAPRSTPTLTLSETQAALYAAVVPTLTAAAGQGFATRNRSWIPVEQVVDGVVMVQVPPGCFMMGSENGRSDERPLHNICFFAPYWIDKFEVTQAQFAALGGVAASPRAFAGDNRPVEQITWFEARDFCTKRGARLPTEAEWEYAARGPDSWTYPWGAEFVETNAVYTTGTRRETADVGSKPLGGAWIGAHDMSGNVWEWTSSQQAAYPYDGADGREADDATTGSIRRVLRGGAWNVDDPTRLRATMRFVYFPVSSDASTGFRCVRSS